MIETIKSARIIFRLNIIFYFAILIVIFTKGDYNISLDFIPKAVKVLRASNAEIQNYTLWVSRNSKKSQEIVNLNSYIDSFILKKNLSRFKIEHGNNLHEKLINTDSLKSSQQTLQEYVKKISALTTKNHTIRHFDLQEAIKAFNLGFPDEIPVCGSTIYLYFDDKNSKNDSIYLNDGLIEKK